MHRAPGQAKRDRHTAHVRCHMGREEPERVRDTERGRPRWRDTEIREGGKETDADRD